MDPQLFDLLWEVYRQSGSDQPIDVVCGYRSPETNGMLRRRSKAVAQNSQHMQGKAIDFFIPGVPLAKLRAIGLRLQAGGVGFYPTSGSPFVHMDTGSVRHWPRMTRQQLVAVFPNGHTLHVPTDGKPLPGYAEALADYKARKASSNLAVASAGLPVSTISVAATAEAGTDETDVAAADVPLPRIADRSTPAEEAAVVALADAHQPEDESTSRPLLSGPLERLIAGAALIPVPRHAQSADPTLADDDPDDANLSDADFAIAYAADGPDVPDDLAAAMAERDVASDDQTTASIPIRPTAVVATVDVTRPLRAEAMTTAVFNGKPDISDRPLPQVLAFASATEPDDSMLRPTQVNGKSVPAAAANTVRHAQPVATAAEPMPQATIQGIYDRLPDSTLTLTVLDTQGLRLWIASQSTREMRYALLTMPDFARSPELIVKPEVAYAAGFDHAAYRGLRTDRFAGPLVQPPAVVDLATRQVVATR